MSDFYSEWLERSKKNEKIVNDAPRIIRSKDLKWVRTRQDYKAALMIAPELGFPTGGSCLPGCHGKFSYSTEIKK